MCIRDRSGQEELPPFQEELDRQEKTKLRFSDVFPSENIDAGSSVDDGGDGRCV